MITVPTDHETGTTQVAVNAKRWRRTAHLGTGVLIAVSVLLVAIGAIVPLIAVLANALAPTAMPRFAEFFASQVDLAVLRNTLVLGVLVGVGGTGLGFLFAYVQTRLDVPGKKILHVIAMMPIVSPPFAVATAAVVLYGRRGVISNGVFGFEYDIYGLDGLVLVLSLSLFPTAYLGLLHLLRRLDPAMEEAAVNLGGTSRWQVMRAMTLPQILPGLVAPFLLLFVEAIADLANPLVLGGDYTVLASRAYLEVVGGYDLTSASVYCVVLLVPSLAMYLGQRWWLRRNAYTPIAGKSSGSVRLMTGRARWAPYALTLLIAAIIVSLYGTVIAGAVTKVFGVDNTLTFEYLEDVLLGVGLEAVLDTLLCAVIATPMAAVTGLVIAWVITRHVRYARWILNVGGNLSIAVPGTVLGIGIVLAYRPDRYIGDVPVFPSLVGGSALAAGTVSVILAYAIRGIPSGQRIAADALSQLHPYIQQTMTHLGATPVQAFRYVTLPLIRPALLTGLGYGFARSMTSVSTIILLVTPETRIITSQVLNAVSTGRYGVAFAYCTVLAAIVLGGFALIRVVVGAGNSMPAASVR